MVPDRALLANQSWACSSTRMATHYHVPLGFGVGGCCRVRGWAFLSLQGRVLPPATPAARAVGCVEECGG